MMKSLSYTWCLVTLWTYICKIVPCSQDKRILKYERGSKVYIYRSSDRMCFENKNTKLKTVKTTKKTLCMFKNFV